jgi:6-phosphogluconolactonase
MIEVAQHTYPDRDTLARSLAELVADQIRGAQTSHRRASLVVPGGSTPEAFLRELAEAELHWPDVVVMLSDERLAEADSDRLNASLLRRTLLRGPAAHAAFIPFAGRPRADAAAAIEAALPIDVAVLGMGTDLHTAALLPGAAGLAEALAPEAPALVEIAPAGAAERRLTLPARILAGANVIHVLIHGPDKAEALARALEEGPVEAAPIRAILTAPCPVSVHYAE